MMESLRRLNQSLVSAVEQAGERIAAGADELSARSNSSSSAAPQGAQGSEERGAGSGQYVRLSAASARKLRWYNHADLAALVAVHTREKRALAAENASLRRGLERALPLLPVGEAEERARLEEALASGEAKVVDEADDGANRVLLLAAAAEVERLKAELADARAPREQGAAGPSKARDGNDGAEVEGAAAGPEAADARADVSARVRELEEQLRAEREAKLALAEAVGVAEEGQRRAEEVCCAAQESLRATQEAADAEREGARQAAEERARLDEERAQLESEVKALTPIREKARRLEESLETSRKAAASARRDKELVEKKLEELKPAADTASRVEALFGKAKEATEQAKAQRNQARDELRAAQGALDAERKRALEAEAAHAALVQRLAEGLSDATDAADAVAAEKERATTAERAADEAKIAVARLEEEVKALREEREVLADEVSEAASSRQLVDRLRERLAEAQRQRDTAEAGAEEATRRAAAADVASTAARGNAAAADAQLEVERKRRAEAEAALAGAEEKAQGAKDAFVVAETKTLEVQAALDESRASERRAILRAQELEGRERDDEGAACALQIADTRAAAAEGQALEANFRAQEFESRLRALAVELRDAKAREDAANVSASAARALAREAAHSRGGAKGAAASAAAAAAGEVPRLTLSGVDLEYLRNTLLKYFERPNEREAVLPVLATLLQCDASMYKKLQKAASAPATTGATEIFPSSWWDAAAAYLPRGH